MDQLWAPWRHSYIAAAKEMPEVSGGCFLCSGCAANEDRSNLVVHRAARSIVMLNRFPYNNGHLLVAPNAHKATLADLTHDELLELQLVLRKMVGVLEKQMSPDGFNIGLNHGRVAGAGLPGHLHWHIVPRWNGDTNFMPVLTDTRVISQSLEALYELLVEELKAG